jgi:hypothetical protein
MTITQAKLTAAEHMGADVRDIERARRHCCTWWPSPPLSEDDGQLVANYLTQWDRLGKGVEGKYGITLSNEVGGLHPDTVVA